VKNLSCAGTGGVAHLQVNHHQPIIPKYPDLNGQDAFYMRIKF
jgi:hypothetical protein